MIKLYLFSFTVVVNVSMRDAKDEKDNGQHFVVLNLGDGSVVTDAVGEY